jgi:hypothetical protein
MNPVGPQSPGVYWFRRVVAVLVVVVLLLGVRWLLTGRGSDGTPTAGAPTSSPTSTPTTSASGTPKPSASSTAKPTASATAKPSASATTARDCKNADIDVTASTDAASYPVGSTPRLRMRIQNSSSSACKRDLGAMMNELVITSGTVHVWSSDDCSSAGSHQIATLQPGQSYSVSVTWLGRISAKGCPAQQPLAQKGTYKLVGRNGDVTSAPAPFALT